MMGGLGGMVFISPLFISTDIPQEPAACAGILTPHDTDL